MCESQLRSLTLTDFIMQKVSGNKKTRVLTHQHKYIANSSLQAPAEQASHLLPQKDRVPAPA